MRHMQQIIYIGLSDNNSKFQRKHQTTMLWPGLACPSKFPRQQPPRSWYALPPRLPFFIVPAISASINEALLSSLSEQPTGLFHIFLIEAQIAKIL